MRMPRFNRRRARSGFSLIEVVVAAAITAVIAGIIAGLVRTVSGNFARAGGRLGADAQARRVLDQLQTDLQGAMYRDDGNMWMAIDVLDRTNNSTLWTEAGRNAKPQGGLSLDIAATRTDLIASERGKLENARHGKAGMWLRFFTTGRAVTNAAGTTVTVPSAPTAVAYQIVRRPMATSSTAQNQSAAYMLHRAEARPTVARVGTVDRPGALETGFNLLAAGYTTPVAANNNGATVGDPVSLRIPGTNSGAARNFDSVLADHVVDFGLRCYVYDATRPGGLRLVFPTNASGALAGTATSTYRPTLPSTTPPGQWGSERPFPDVIDVAVRVLTEEGAAQIANIEKVQTPVLQIPQKYNNNASQWWWGVAQENSRVYTRRIVINAKPL